VSVAQNPAPGGIVTGNTTVTLTATDDQGNSSSCTFQVIVSDDIAPSIACPSSQSGLFDSNCEFALPDYTALATAGDNCDASPVLTQFPSAGAIVTGNTTVTLTATDAAGNSSSCSFEVTVSDQSPPSITCPGNQSETLDENGEFILPDYTSLGTASDNCDATITVAQSPVAGTIVTGNTTVTLTATDAAGNSGSCTFLVVVASTGGCQEVLFRVNNGGVQTAAGDASIPAWGEDTQANPSPYVTLGTCSNCNKTYSTINSIDMTHPSLIGTGITEAIMKTERWDHSDLPNMIWSFPVTPGSQVQVKLFFAELFVNNPGDRIFDVAVEGVVPPVFDNIDAIALTGAKFKGIMLSHTQVVDDGSLDLEFLRIIQNPTIKAIEVCLMSGEEPPCNLVVTVNSTDPASCTENGSVDIQVSGGSGNEVITIYDQNDNPSDPGNLPPGNYTYEVNDGSCQATGSFSINQYNDDAAPTIACPSNQSGSFDSNCEFPLPDYTALATAGDNCDAAPAITQSPAVGATVTGNTTVTLTATDAAGNSSSCSFEVTVSDETPPSITCPGDQNEALDENGEFILPDYTGLAAASDNCDAIVNVTQNPTAGTIVTTNTTVTLTATDAAGNSSSCTFEVIPSDQLMLSITCPGDQTGSLNSNCEFTLPDYTGLATVSYNGAGTVNVAQSPAPGVTVTGNTTVTLTATDDQGNSSSCTFQVIVSDDTAPTIACPSDQSGSFDSNCEFALPDYTALATAGDNCDASPGLTQFPAAGAIVTGNTTVTLTATDAAGNSSSCSFEVTVSDETPPAITCPGDQNEALDENGEFILPDYTGLAAASDNCDAIVNVTQNPTAGTIVTTNTTVTLTATDAAGNSSSCTFEVIPSDQLMLSITCPGDQTGSLNSNCEFTLPDYTGLATVSYNGAGTVSVAQSPAPGVTVTGNTTMTLTATDDQGNSSSCTFQVIVSDDAAPTIACPSSQSGSLDSNCEFALPDYTALATTGDNCDASPGLTQFPAAGAIVTGNTMVTLTATDAAGNSSSCSFEVTVSDETPPAITCPGDQNEALDENGEFILPDYTGLAAASDNCDAIVNVTQNPTAGTIVTTNTTVTLTATDATGNSSNCTFEVIPSNQVMLSITCPGDQTGSLNSNCEFTLPDYTGLATVSYNGPGTVSVAQSPGPGQTVAGNTTVTLTATDDQGNSSSCTFQVIVSDDIAPTIACPSDQSGSLDSNCEFALPDYTGLATASDNCDAAPAITQSPAVGATVTGNTTVTLTATDEAGNTSLCVFNVAVMDVQSPVAVCQAVTLQLSADGTATLGEAGLASSSDNCGVADVSVSQNLFTCDDIGENFVIYTVTDFSGNTGVCTSTVTVVAPSDSGSDWSNQDVGNAPTPGSAQYDPCTGEFTVNSNGFEASDKFDAFHFVYQNLCGDGIITAQVTGISSATGIVGLAGVTMRKNLNKGSPHVSLLTRLDDIVHRRIRTSQSGTANNQQFSSPGVSWLRLERTGSTITGYASPDGIAWTFIFTTNVNLGSCILVGFAVESYSQNVTTTATFENVSLTGPNVSPIAVPPSGNPSDNVAFGVELYPNPVDESLNVVLENAPDDEVELEIMDLNGRQLYRQILDEALPHIEVNLKPLGIPDGVYILRIRMGGQFFTERFIKRKIN
jgi:hypothetical protein